ncbi:site-specific integrase [Microbacterium enclense]|uniref:tyrosine-type recombinase/integrase n=1 Tax=Microbacterium enclense TaxID=993073 RepID=UPI0021A8B27D|nr:site-specific integrase [Microbacterium enclense]MCT2085019.1 site-specific integrase [Microbacterium enclense]
MSGDDLILARRRAWLLASNSTEKSIRERTIVIRAMLKRTGATLLDVTRDELVADLARPGIAASTRSQYKSTMYGFFTWLQEEGDRLDNPAARLPRVKVPKREPNPFPTGDIQRLLNSGIYRRMRLWVLLYAYQALRAGEIAAVRGDKIDWTNRRILSWEAKGGRFVWRPIHDLVWPELERYRDVRGWLFPTKANPLEHVSPATVSNSMSKAIKRAGIMHRAHDLRGWHATELIERDVPTVVVAHSLRHADTQTVQKYARVSDDTLTAAVTRLPVVEVPARAARQVA